MRSLIFLLLACTITFVQCKQAEQKVTKEEALKFAANMEQIAMKRSSNLIAANIILPALTSRMVKEKEIKDMDEVEKGMAQGLKNSELDKNVYGIIGKNGSFEKVKLYEKDGIQRIIFRAYGDEGLNYLDIELTKLNGKVGIADMLVYSSGENISKSLADLMKKMMDEPNDKNAEDAKATFQTIKRLMAKGNYKEAKKEFDQLPYYVKNTRIADVLNIQISSNLGDEIYMKEIEKFETKYAGDPNVQLTMIDLYFLRKDYDKALTAINVIDSVINKDSFLDYYRGLVWNVKGNSDKAIEYYKKVTENNPAFPGAYAELMAHYLERNDRQQAKIYFTKYKSLRDAKEDVINTYETIYPFLKEQD